MRRAREAKRIHDRVCVTGRGGCPCGWLSLLKARPAGRRGIPGGQTSMPERRGPGLDWPPTVLPRSPRDSWRAIS